jgi:hypothetical protein
MKKFNLFVMAALSATYSLTSCSSDDEIQSEPVEQSQAKSTSYLTVNLQLANSASASTRGSGAMSYNDGNPYEYAVKSATLYIYQDADKDGNAKTDENDFSLVCESELSLSPSVDTNSADLVTSESKAVKAQLDGFKKTEGRKYYALVLINRPTDLKDPSAGFANFGAWKEAVWNESGQLSAYATNTSADTYKGIYMANALMATVKDGASVRNLTPIPDTEIVNSEADLEKDGVNGVNIYVERSCAKFTVSEAEGKNYWETADNTTGVDLTTKSTTMAGKILLKGFAAHNVNTVAFPIHVLSTPTYGGISDEDITRMTTTTDLPFYNLDNTWNAADGEPVNWAYTPRYYGHSVATSVLTDDVTSAWNATAKTWECTYLKAATDAMLASDKVAYVTENCQEYSDMHESVTTSIVLKAQWAPSSTAADGTTTFTAGQSVIICNGKLYTDDTFKAAIAAADVTYTGTPELAKITSKKAAAQSTALVLDDEILPGATAEQLAKINEALNTGAGDGLLRYEDGICYYVIYPRHFEDTYAAYPTAANETAYTVAQLGRYGVVRNHWYDVCINSIALPGTPYIPDVPDPKKPDPENPDPDQPDPDPEVDKTDKYLDFTLQQMAWAKRTNSVKF